MLLLAAGLASARSITIRDAADGKRITLSRRDTLVVALQANVTTGHHWKLASAPVHLAAAGDASYTSAPHAPGMTGVGGTYRARFVSTGRGLDSLRFAYLGPGGDTARVFRTLVRVIGTRK